MTDAELRAAVLDSLAEVAPEADPGALDPARPIIDQVDIDSMDFLDFLVAVAERTGVEVPERDYAAVDTIDACVAYLAGRVGEPA
ncbi:MAG: acyl carrier protein [Thermoleophilaceae bacterium]|nr:acyl carrier protein [Thermoleophilaceae bacterium]